MYICIYAYIYMRDDYYDDRGQIDEDIYIIYLDK